MTEAPISVEQFIACLKQQLPVSSKIKAANQLDVSALSKNEQQHVADALTTFAMTKNGPMLIMGLPGPLQALLSFSGIAMPGQDRLAYLRATPRQALVRLAHYDDRSLLEGYPFDKASKADWACYLSEATTIIEPCKKFLSRAESAGGFSDAEWCEIIERNSGILRYVPIARILPDLALKLLSSDFSSYIRANYDFKRFEKAHWYKLLTNGAVTSIHDDCIPFLENKDGRGFSNAEIIAIARKCPLVSRWINPAKTSFLDAYELYVAGNADVLWNKYPFSSLNKDEWLVILRNSKIAIPNAFSTAVSAGMFATTELLDLARHNERIVPFLSVADLDIDILLDFLGRSKTEYLWTIDNLKRLNADQWVELIKKRKPLIPGKFLQPLRNANQLCTRHVTAILDVDYRYYTYVPLELIPCDRIIKYLLSGDAEDLWHTYPFKLFKEDDWFSLLEQPGNPVPDAGKLFLANASGTVNTDRLNLLLAKRTELVGYMRPQDIDPKLAVGFLTQSPDSNLWKSYDFSRFDNAQVQTIVVKSADRDFWPEAIAAKFSDGEDSLSDDAILSIAEGSYPVEGNLTNVVELLSVARIHKSGVYFFGRICKRIPQVKAASATVIRKLSLGDKPWQKLNRDFLTCLLIDAPICRKFINWQDYELGTIDKLVSSNHAYNDELRAGRKLKLLVWRHWLSFVILFAFASCIAFVIAKALHEAAKERAIAERRNNITFRINELSRRLEFQQLQQYVDSVDKGGDADILQQDNVSDALKQLSHWHSKRDSLDTALRSLESLSAAHWPDDSLEESKQIFNQLRINDSVEPDERVLIRKFYSSYSSRIEEIECVKRNERLAAQIAKMINDCHTCNSAESLVEMLAELTQISDMKGLSAENAASCSEAVALARTRVNNLYKTTLKSQHDILDQTKDENEVAGVLNVLGSIQSDTYASKENIHEANSLRNLANKKATELHAAEMARLAAEKEVREKQEVEAIALKVKTLRSQFDTTGATFDDNKVIKIREDLDALTACPSYGRFCKENSREIPELSSHLEMYEKGIASADELVRKCTDIENKYANHMLDGKERKVCEDLILQLDSWIEGYASTTAWKIKSVETHRTKITNLIDESNAVKTLIDKANGASDYEALCVTISTILERHSGFSELQEIDPLKILSKEQVLSAIEDRGLFSTKRLFNFAGLIKINPKSKGSVVPLLNNSATNATYIYCVTKAADSEANKKGVKIKRIFERTANGGIRRVAGIDYSRCQGVGLFISTDPSYIDPDSWVPGMTHPYVPHWMASSVYGEWIPEPGYVKSSLLGGALSQVKWCPAKTYLDEKARSGEHPGEWQVVAECSSCKGTGYSYYLDYAGYPRKGGLCFYCNGKRYVWQDITDSKMIAKLIEMIKNSLTKGGE